MLSLSQRRQAAQRLRPLILDDDGDMVYDARTAGGPGAFLQLRHTDLLDTPVNSLAWCIMWGIAKGTAESVRYWQTQQLDVSFHEDMPDPTPVVERFCHQHDIEVFGSIRMNDCHDAFGMPSRNLLYPLKVEHPELLLGDETQRGGVADGLQAAMWSALNYALPEVRRDRLGWIEHTATAYDLDGVDLNFFRMPFLFEPGQEEANLIVMTEFMREARRIVDAASQRRGRPLLLGVRVPDTVETCLGIGIDLAAWLREYLVDRVLSGGGYASLCMPAEELIELGHRHDVPVYPCINCPGTFSLGAGEGFESLRGAAANFWHAGADGIYLWNYQYLDTPHLAYGQPTPDDYTHLAELADPVRLARLDKVFGVNPATWEQYARASAPCPLPRALDDREFSLEIRIGDDLSSAARVELELDFDQAVSGDRCRVQFGDRVFEGVDVQSVGLSLDPISLCRGKNRLAIAVSSRGTAAERPLVLQGVRVRVCYRHS